MEDVASFGSIGGGWLPMKFINSGWTVFRSRKTSMLIYAIAVLPILFVQYLGTCNMWIAVSIVVLAMAAHQAWSANIFTTVPDMFPSIQQVWDSLKRFYLFLESNPSRDLEISRIRTVAGKVF
ncbi:MAG: hypothetical protein WKF87_05840 [Chryseolinea sp.]